MCLISLWKKKDLVNFHKISVFLSLWGFMETAGAACLPRNVIKLWNILSVEGVFTKRNSRIPTSLFCIEMKNKIIFELPLFNPRFNL